MTDFIRHNRAYLLLLLLLGAFAVFGILLRGWIMTSSATSLRHELSSLMNQADRLSGEIELEIAFMEESLAPGAREFQERDGAAFTARWEEFHEQARFPGFLRAAYFFPLRSARPYRFDPESGTFFETGDDDPLAQAIAPFAAGDGSENANLAQDLRDLLALASDGESYRVRSITAVERQDPRIAPRRGDAPFIFRRFEQSLGFLILALDDTVLSREILPSLGEQYFGKKSGYGDFILRAFKPGYPDCQVAIGSAKVSSGTDWSTNDFSRPLISPQIRLNIYGLYATASGHADRDGRTTGLFSSFDEMPDSPIDAFRFIFQGAKGGWIIEAKHRSGSLPKAIGMRSGLESLLAFSFLLGAYALIAGLVLSSRRSRMFAERERDFIASVSHELKTPITVILSASENMEKGIIAPDRVSAYGAMLAKEGRRLRDSVEGILMVAGIQSAHHGSRSETFPLSDLVRESVAKMEDLAASRNAKLTVLEEQKPIVKASKAMIGSALTSLITNALKYGPEGGEVTLRIRASGASGRRRAEVCAEDRGPGIGYAERSRVFDPFWRGSSAGASAQAGTGLGLYLARRIARLHSGDVVFKPRQGGGSCFSLTLPEEIEA